MSLNLTIAARVKEERLARGWTQLDLLERSGWPIKPAAMSLLERGRRRFRDNVIEAFAKAFGIDAADLLRGAHVATVTEATPAA